VIQHPLAVAAVLLGAIFFAVSMTRRFTWAARLSTVLWVIFTGALVSNAGLVPKDAPLYGSLVDFTVPFAVCVILFTVNLSDVRKAGKAVLAAFGLATMGTVVGVMVSGLVLEPFLADILGEESWKLAGPYTGTYVGGSLNFFALWEGLDLGRPDLFAAANAVDNLTLFPLYAAWMVIPTWLVGRYATRRHWQVDRSLHARGPDAPAPSLVPAHVVALAFLAILVMALSEWIKTAWIDPVAPAIPTILIVTTLALVVGQFPAVRRLEGAWEIGDLAFYVFFVSVGAMIDFYQAVVLSPILFAYVLVIMAGHFVVVFGVGRLLGMDPAVLTIASVATKAGPPLIPAVAHAKGWEHLVLPGIIAGMLGYAIGNYVGFAAAYLMRALL
jgi:uncharacterized membrane protein